MLPRLSHIKRVFAMPFLLAAVLLFMVFERMSEALIGHDPYDTDDEESNS